MKELNALIVMPHSPVLKGQKIKDFLINNMNKVHIVCHDIANLNARNKLFFFLSLFLEAS